MRDIRTYRFLKKFEIQVLVKFVDVGFFQTKIFMNRKRCWNNNATTMESSKFVFRPPLHQLRCNVFRFLIMFSSPHSLHSKAEVNCSCTIPYSSPKMRSIVP